MRKNRFLELEEKYLMDMLSDLEYAEFIRLYREAPKELRKEVEERMEVLMW